jgi:hypothetical protein
MRVHSGRVSVKIQVNLDKWPGVCEQPEATVPLHSSKPTEYLNVVATEAEH